MGEEGFSADSALLYHRGLPSALVDARPWELPDQSLTTNSPLVPRHLKLHDLFPGEEHKSVDAVTGRRLVLGNADVRISYAVSSLPSPYYRNAVGDECVFVERGTATVETVFGALDVGPGDYVILPRATTHRWLPDGEEPLRTYAIEANSHITPPKRYLSRYGQLLEHAPYCERDLRAPDEPLLADGHRRRGVRQAPRRRPRGAGGHGARAAGAPVRRRRLGRLPLPVRLQRERLRADHRAGAPAAAGAPGLRGHQLRDLQLRAAQGRLPPAGRAGARTTTRTSTATRSCSTSTATTRRARARASARARSACTRAVTRTGRSPARWSARSARTTSTSSPSWSTRSGRWPSARAAPPWTTARTPGPGRVAGPRR